jgi:hypothetical protein
VAAGSGPDPAGGTDLDAAFAAIDAANADDPFTIVARGVERPKEQAHAEMAVEWVRRLDPQASDALLLAARAHHVRRWEIPRAAEADGREGYLRWKSRLQRRHAEVVGEVLPAAGVDPATVSRVQDLVRKRRLKSDPEVQTLEDALSLVFVETQLAELAAKLDEDHLVDVVAKTLAKMTPAGRAAALALPLDAEATRIVGRALAAVAA